MRTCPKVRFFAVAAQLLICVYSYKLQVTMKHEVRANKYEFKIKSKCTRKY